LVRRAGKRVMMTVAVLGCLLSAIGSGGTVVLCLGEDGHVAVETGARGSRCDSFTGRDASPAPPAVNGKPASGLSPCGSCVDIPLLTDHTAVARGVERNPSGSGNGSRCVSLPERPRSIPEPAPGLRPASNAPACRRAAAALSTTILLI